MLWGTQYMLPYTVIHQRDAEQLSLVVRFAPCPDV